jgi:phosphoribosylglycinamide formyltransferase-1
VSALTTRRPRIVVIVSGSGTNLQALIDAVRDGSIAADIVTVFSDRRAAYALERATAAGIPAVHVVVKRSDTPGYDAELLERVAATAPDLVVLAGYMRILSPRFVSAFSDRILNIHPSLLPRHRGVDTHRRVIDAGDADHGATVHFVTDELDAGPRIAQYRIKVRPGDTAETLAARVHAGEYIILPLAVSWFAAGRLSLTTEGIMLDGKRLNEPVIREGEP